MQANIGKHEHRPAASTSRIYLSVDFRHRPARHLPCDPDGADARPRSQENVQNFTVTLPANLAPGTLLHRRAFADYYNQIGETNEGDNNGNILTITVTPPPPPAKSHTVCDGAERHDCDGQAERFRWARRRSISAMRPQAHPRLASTSQAIRPSRTEDTVLAIQSVGALAAGIGTTQKLHLPLRWPANLAFPETYYIGRPVRLLQTRSAKATRVDNNANLITLTILPPNLTENRDGR